MNENLIIELEANGIVTGTFRRLSPAKKEKVYNAALNAFASEVFDRVAIDGICTEAGISKGSLFQYFANKENLFAFLCEIFIDNYNSFWGKFFFSERAVAVKDRIRDFILEQISYFRQNQTEGSFYFKMFYENSSEISNYFIVNINEVNKKYFSSVIERSMVTGETRQDIDSKLIAEFLLMVSNGILYNHLYQFRDTDVDFNDELDKTLSIIFDGLNQ